MIERHDGLVTAQREVTLEERVLAEEVKNDDLPILCAQPHGVAHGTHGRDTRLANREGLGGGGGVSEYRMTNTVRSMMVNSKLLIS